MESLHRGPDSRCQLLAEDAAAGAEDDDVPLAPDELDALDALDELDAESLPDEDEALEEEVSRLEESEPDFEERLSLR